MAESSGRTPHREIEFSVEADIDRTAIYLYTERQWSSGQAETYDAFLQDVMQQLLENPMLAPLVPNLSGVRSQVVRWANAQHGHRIFFEETSSGIHILRILHTAMNWQSHLGES